MNTFNVPMESISDGAVKVHCYELYHYEWGTVTAKKIESHDEGDSHPKPLKRISQYPDCKRTRIRGLDDHKHIESHGSHEHLKPI